jgi:hypothetical protein
VNSFTRGLGLALLSVGMLGVTGCTDNETDAQKLQKDMGDPGPGNPSSKVQKSDVPTPRTQEERFKQQGDPKKVMGPNYPGAKTK